MTSRPASDGELDAPTDLSPPPDARSQGGGPAPGPDPVEAATVPEGHRLVRASGLTGLDVVTLEGNRAVEVKDVVFDKAAGTLTGFTLRKPGLLGGPQKSVLPVSGVQAVGRDAVMIPSHAVLAGPEELVGSGDNIIGDRVITDDGTELGIVVDVIASVHDGVADVIGFEITASANADPDGGLLLVPMPAAHSMSGEAVVVPARVREHLSRDLDGLQASVRMFRTQQDEA